MITIEKTRGPGNDNELPPDHLMKANKQSNHTKDVSSPAVKCKQTTKNYQTPEKRLYHKR